MQTRAEARPHKQFEDNMSVKTVSVLISIGVALCSFAAVLFFSVAAVSFWGLLCRLS